MCSVQSTDVEFLYQKICCVQHSGRCPQRYILPLFYHPSFLLSCISLLPSLPPSLHHCLCLSLPPFLPPSLPPSLQVVQAIPPDCRYHKNRYTCIKNRCPESYSKYCYWIDFHYAIKRSVDENENVPNLNREKCRPPCRFDPVTDREDCGVQGICRCSVRVEMTRS